MKSKTALGAKPIAYAGTAHQGFGPARRKWLLIIRVRLVKGFSARGGTSEGIFPLGSAWPDTGAVRPGPGPCVNTPERGVLRTARVRAKALLTFHAGSLQALWVLSAGASVSSWLAGWKSR